MHPIFLLFIIINLHLTCFGQNVSKPHFTLNNETFFEMLRETDTKFLQSLQQKILQALSGSLPSKLKRFTTTKLGENDSLGLQQHENTFRQYSMSVKGHQFSEFSFDVSKFAFI